MIHRSILDMDREKKEGGELPVTKKPRLIRKEIKLTSKRNWWRVLVRLGKSKKYKRNLPGVFANERPIKMQFASRRLLKKEKKREKRRKNLVIASCCACIFEIRETGNEEGVRKRMCGRESKGTFK